MVAIYRSRVQQITSFISSIMVRSIDTDENASFIDRSTVSHHTATGKHSAAPDSTFSFSNIHSISIPPGLAQEAKHKIEELEAKLALLGDTYNTMICPHKGRVEILSYLDQTSNETSVKLKVVELFIEQSQLALTIFQKNGGLPPYNIIKGLKELSNSLDTWGKGAQSVTESDISKTIEGLLEKGDDWQCSLSKSEANLMPSTT
jgi:hypothetical protein